jgi:hypothetical protein
MRIKDLKKLIAKAEEHFLGQCWLYNVNQELQDKNFSDEDEFMLTGFCAPGTEVCKVCGCGHSEAVQDLYRRALRAIKERSEWMRGKAIGDIMKMETDRLCKAVTDAVNGNSEKRPNPTLFRFCDNEMLEEVILHVLNELGYTQHGTSVYGSWLTDKGETALMLLDAQFEGMEDS